MTAAGDDPRAMAIRAALRDVLDPELGENLVDLGMIYAVDVDARGAARIVMTTTTPGCPAAEMLREGVAVRAAAVPGIETAEVTLTFDPPWGPGRISAGIRHRLGFAAVQ
jgi:metal-sulfur cluster biosynthetic enzyme